MGISGGALRSFCRRVGELVRMAETSWERILSVLVRLLPLFVIGFVAVVVWTLGRADHWPFALHAQSRSLELMLPASSETSWNVSGATLCVRSPLTAAEPFAAIQDRARVSLLCGSRRWQAYVLPETHPGRNELIAIIGDAAASTAAPSSPIRISSTREGRVLVDVTTPTTGADTQPQVLRLYDSSGIVLTLPQPASFVWRTDELDRPLVFPYTSAIRVGQDVNAVRTELLETGSINIFSPSDRSVAGRAVIESIELMPGDMVNLSPSGSGNKAYFPRGFIRLDPQADGGNWPMMEVLAYGVSSSVEVHRFGDAGLSFRPGIWARLTHSNAIVTWSLILFGGLSVLAGLAEARGLAKNGAAQA